MKVIVSALGLDVPEKAAAIFKVPPSIVNDEPLPYLKSSPSPDPTLKIPAVIRKEPFNVTSEPWAVTVAFELLNHKPPAAGIEYAAAPKKVFVH